MRNRLGKRPVRLFISHNQREKPWVRQLVSQLRALGFLVFFDEDSIQPGDNFVSAIERGISESNHIILILSGASLASRWVALELAMAILDDPDGQDRRIIPVMIDPLEFSALPLSIRRLQIVDLTDNTLRDQRYHHLLRSIGVTISNLPSAPDQNNNGAYASCEERQSTDTIDSKKAAWYILVFVILVSIMSILFLPLPANRPSFRGSNIAYVMDISSSVRYGLADREVPYSEFTTSLLRSIDIVAKSPLSRPQRHQVVQLGDGLIQKVLCQETITFRHLDFERSVAIRRFMESCRVALGQRSPAPRTEMEIALKYATILTNPDDETEDVIIMFSDLQTQTVGDLSIADRPNLKNTCVVVFYVFPSGTASPVAMDNLIEFWSTRLKSWGARDLRLWHVAGFNEMSLAEFITQCSSAHLLQLR